MDLTLTPSEETFRQELLDWLKHNLPTEWKNSRIRCIPEEEAYEIRKEWSLRMGAAGWLGVAWPREYGGRGATLMEQVIYQEELHRLDAPEPLDGVGLQYLGPTVIEAGSSEQKAKHLPPIIRGESKWYQGFSEPNAGSDLAALSTRADLDGDTFVVNGEKLWGGARHCEWGALLVRTDPDAPKHRGISFLMVDMSSPGITPRPVRGMDADFEMSAVYFDSVRVPRSNLLGEINQGWFVANRLLTYERGLITMAFLVKFQAWWEELRDFARTTRRNGQLLVDHPRIRERLAQTYTDIQQMRLANLRYITGYLRGKPPGEETSYMKLFWATTEQGLADLASAIGGPDFTDLRGSPRALAEGTWTEDYLFSRAVTIYGGTQDIQRNIIAERIFGLPR